MPRPRVTMRLLRVLTLTARASSDIVGLMFAGILRRRGIHPLPFRLPTLATLFALVLMLTGCAGVTAANAQEETEWRGGRGGKEAFSAVVARTPEAWRALWQGIRRPPPVEFDASRDIAAALFLGQRRSGGYGITIESVERRGAFIVVRFQEIRPAPDAMVTMALTSPYLVRLLPNTELAIAFERADVVDGGLLLPESEARVLEGRLETLRDELERLRVEDGD